MKLLLTSLTTLLCTLALAACTYAQSAPTPATRSPVHRLISASGYDITPLSKAEVHALAQKLTPQQRAILLHADTEAPYCSGLVENHKSGIFVSALGGLPLFRSSAKFESGSGWPSFFAPIDPEHVIERRDTSAGMDRVEILDARSGGHLGHVFDDGPAPTGKRSCLNGEALVFIPDGVPIPLQSQPIKREVAYFAGGCFWGIEDLMQRTPGVIEATSGFMGGSRKQPSYEEVCTGETGHAETVEVTYDANQVSYRDLLDRLFQYIDPTTLNRQGPDAGTQYRSVVFAANAAQKREAEAYLRTLAQSERLRGLPIATTVERAQTFWPAEAYHQDWHEKHGGSCEN